MSHVTKPEKGRCRRDDFRGLGPFYWEGHIVNSSSTKLQFVIHACLGCIALHIPNGKYEFPGSICKRSILVIQDLYKNKQNSMLVPLEH